LHSWAVADTIWDTCQISVRTAPDVDNPQGSLAAYGDTLACGFDDKAQAETGDAQTPRSQAIVRLPLGTDVSGIDRVKVLTKMGTALDPERIYAMIGDPRVGATAIQLLLKQTTETSVE